MQDIRPPSWREGAVAALGFAALSFLFCYPAGLSTTDCILTGDALASYFPYLLRSFRSVSPQVAGAWDPAILTGALMALHALGSLVQMIVLGGFAWLTFLAYYGIVGPGSRCGRRRFVFGGLAACVLGAIGSLPQTLPMLEVSHWSGYGEFNSDFFNSGYLKFRFLVGLAGPWVLGGKFGATLPTGYWGLTEHGIFYGVLPLMSALVAILWLVSGRVVNGEWPQVGASFQLARQVTNLPPRLTAHDSHLTTHSLPTRKEAGLWLV